MMPVVTEKQGSANALRMSVNAYGRTLQNVLEVGAKVP
jgi:hypothetical protein